MGWRAELQERRGLEGGGGWGGQHHSPGQLRNQNEGLLWGHSPAPGQAAPLPCVPSLRAPLGSKQPANHSLAWEPGHGRGAPEGLWTVSQGGESRRLTWPAPSWGLGTGVEAGPHVPRGAGEPGARPKEHTCGRSCGVTETDRPRPSLTGHQPCVVGVSDGNPVHKQVSGGRWTSREPGSPLLENLSQTHRHTQAMVPGSPPPRHRPASGTGAASGAQGGGPALGGFRGLGVSAGPLAGL